MQFHEVANIFPMLNETELQELADDIRLSGLHHPITLYEGKILDGRNRYAACFLAGVEPSYTEYDGDDPTGFVISENIKRRHLDESQRAMCAGRLETMQRGRPGKDANLHVSRSSASEMLNVSPRSVASAKTVIDQGVSELAQAVDAGKISVSKAAQLTKAPEETQKKIVDKIMDGVKPQEAARQVLAESYQERPPSELPRGKRYRVVYADPPWSYGNTSIDQMGEQRDHYPVMSMTEICAMPIENIVEKDAVLFLWVTSPILEEAFAVIRAWGFQYKASFVWDKVKHVMGHYNSVRHELLLVCVRGSCQPDERKLFDSVVTEERTEHSKKPETFRRIIETLYTYGNKIELFAREQNEGWDAYGNESLS